MSATSLDSHTIETIRLHELETLNRDECDRLSFGVIGLTPDMAVDLYNATEQKQAGLSPDKVLGLNYFVTVAPCMNNFMVAQRYEDEPELDAIIDFVLTLRMRPTPVRLRLLQSPLVARRYVLVERRIRGAR